MQQGHEGETTVQAKTLHNLIYKWPVLCHIVSPRFQCAGLPRSWRCSFAIGRFNHRPSSADVRHVVPKHLEQQRHPFNCHDRRSLTGSGNGGSAVLSGSGSFTIACVMGNSGQLAQLLISHRLDVIQLFPSGTIVHPLHQRQLGIPLAHCRRWPTLKHEGELYAEAM